MWINPVRFRSSSVCFLCQGNYHQQHWQIRLWGKSSKGSTEPCTLARNMPHSIYENAVLRGSQELSSGSVVLSMQTECLQSGLCRAKKCQPGSAAPRASGAWRCSCALPDRWCGEAVGKRRVITFSWSLLPWEWCKRRQTWVSMMGYETKMWSMIT